MVSVQYEGWSGDGEVWGGGITRDWRARSRGVGIFSWDIADGESYGDEEDNSS